MRASAFTSPFIARLRMRRDPAAVQRAQQNGSIMSSIIRIKPARGRKYRGSRRIVAPLLSIAIALSSFVALNGLTVTAALACACGCSVFDVGGLDLPQEQDHGGRIFFEYWSAIRRRTMSSARKLPAL